MTKTTNADMQELASPAMFGAHPYKRPRIVLQEDGGEPLPSGRSTPRLAPVPEKLSMQRNLSPQHAQGLREGREMPVTSGVYDLPMRHRDALDMRPTSPHPTIVQRRGYPVSGRVPALHLTDHDRDAPPAMARESLVQSAPPQQPQFPNDMRLPPPTHLFGPADKTRYNAQSRSPPPLPLPPPAPEMQGFMPAPGGASRVYMAASPSMPLPSSAYFPNVTSPFRPPADAGHPMEPMQGSDALHTAPPNKGSFLSLFSSFYDSLSDSQALLTTLEKQISTSNAIIQSLQQSRQVMEDIAEQHCSHHTQVSESRYKHLEARYAELEQRCTRLETQLKLSQETPDS